MKSEKEWKTAYEEKVRQVINYNSFSVSKKSISLFSKLTSLYPEANPFDFMEAVFPPQTVWWTKTKRGKWKKLDFPFPNMLTGTKAENAYQKYMKKYPVRKKSTEEEIIDSIKLGFSRFSSLRIELNDLEGIYYLTVDGTLSPFLFLGISGAFDWYVLQVNSGAIESDFFEELQEKYNFLQENVELKKKIKEIVEEHARN